MSESAFSAGSARALLYARTLPTLRAAQVVGRVWRRLRKPKPDLAAAPPRRTLSELVPGAERDPVLLAPNTFRLLNVEGRLGEAADWNDPLRARLWTYHLHYFDDLNAAGAAGRLLWQAQLIARWVTENPPGTGAGWEPYPTSLRLVNWIKWVHAGHTLPRGAEHSLAIQARWLRASLETHLYGNHLLANAKALCFVGLYFRGREAEAWLAKGLSLLKQELGEQILDDGGHFERSPMYHALILEDVLDLHGLLRGAGDRLGSRWQDLPRELAEIAGRMRRWLAVMVHPDGDFSFFNDTALGVVPRAAALEDYAERLGLPAFEPVPSGLVHLPESGYVRMQRGAAVLLADVGEVGPRYLPGHAHADTLSFEFSLGAQRVIVNSGTSVYESGEERLRQRSTAAHSTVLVDGEDSTEVWDSFRVARRAHPFGLGFGSEDAEVLTAIASHDGYARLPGRIEHRREWRLGENSLTVRDHLDGEFLSAEARYFLHPGIGCPSESATTGFLTLPGGQHMAWAAHDARTNVARTTWHPGFNRSEPNHCLRLVPAAAEATLELHY